MPASSQWVSSGEPQHRFAEPCLFDFLSFPNLLLQTLSDVTVKEGELVKLECAVKGQPHPEVKWYREGTLVTSSMDFEIKYTSGVSSLTIPEIYYDDAGQYACAATNSKGTKSTSCNVRVLRKSEVYVSFSY